MKKSITVQILELMSDWIWHSNRELSYKSWRFWWHLYQLRKQWVIFEKKQWEWYIEYFRLIELPKYLDIVNWRLKDRSPKQIEIKITKTEPPIVRFEKQWIWNSFISLFK